MAVYAVRRRCGWSDLQSLEISSRKSSEIIRAEMSQHVQWIRSYVVSELDRRFGTVCILDVEDVELIAQHADKVGIPCDEVLPIATTMILRADPGAIHFRY